MKKLKHHWSCPVITHGEPYLDNCYCEEKAMKKLDREDCACNGCSKERSARIAADIAEKVAQAQQQFMARGAATTDSNIVWHQHTGNSMPETLNTSDIIEILNSNDEKVAGEARGFSWGQDEITKVVAYKMLRKAKVQPAVGLAIDTAVDAFGYAMAAMAFQGKPSVCQEADKVIKDRHETYGSPKQNFDDIAALWDVAFGYKMTEMFTASDVAQAMRLVKEARLINDPTHRDSLVDICGYAECQNEVNNGDLVDELA